MAALLEMLNCGAFTVDEVGICSETNAPLDHSPADLMDLKLQIEPSFLSVFRLVRLPHLFARAVLRDCYM